MSERRSTMISLKRTAVAVAIAAAGLCAVAGVARADIVGGYVLNAPSTAIWAVPAGTDVAQIVAEGAKGGDFYNDDGSRIAGGLGGLAAGTLVVTPGEKLLLWAGGSGGAG